MGVNPMTQNFFNYPPDEIRTIKVMYDQSLGQYDRR